MTINEHIIIPPRQEERSRAHRADRLSIDMHQLHMILLMAFERRCLYFRLESWFGKVEAYQVAFDTLRDRFPRKSSSNDFNFGGCTYRSEYS